ncbi:hypothetical protein RG47T_1935 [Mucilaginibacter polytrichastri]|uniref:Uncharacterized protein n=1 Tax=Mucilaginibacter polytrichastri TaxID=1302689 RepID=A0A1Q5ZXJ7_9SPHI|nr:hypothetical protein RG47T_1935 [Mucilaginibacter polytrichastri]
MSLYRLKKRSKFYHYSIGLLMGLSLLIAFFYYRAFLNWLNTNLNAA